MAKYLSNVQKNLKVGIVSYTESNTVLEVTGKVGIGTANATTNLDVNGGIRVRGSLYDNTNSSGNVGQILISTGTGVDWIDISSTGVINGITIKDENDIVGTANSITSIIFSGPNVTATGSNTEATITIEDYVSVSGVSTYSNNAGISSYSNSSGISTNIKGGSTGNILYQSATDITDFVDVASAIPGQVLLWNGSTPSWGNVSAASGAFGGISILDEGNLVGTSGSTTTLNIIGPNVVATSGASGIVTITVADYVSNAGVSTSVIGIASVTQLSVSGISTLSQLSVGSSTGTNGQYLKSTGSGMAWESFPTIRSTTNFNASANQSTFNVSYEIGYIDVYINGIRIFDTEFTADNGTSVNLNSPCFGGEEVTIIAYNTTSTGGSFANANYSGVITATGGFSSGTGNPVKISVVGSTIVFNVPGIGSTIFSIS